MPSPCEQRRPRVSKIRRRRASIALFGAIASMLVLATSCSGGGADEAASATQSLSLIDLTNETIPLRTGEVDPPSAPAASPDDAVAAFARLEAAGDHISSWRLLDSSLRESLRTAAEWERRHAHLPQLTSFDAEATVVDDDGTAAVTGTATYQPGLDEVVGAVPARANVTWRAVAEDGGWRVDFAATTVRAVWPDDASAKAAVEQWLEARRRCEAPVDLEYRGGLVGSTTVADRLCDNDAPIDVGDAERLGDVPDPAAVLAAFGPGADEWARQLELSGGIDGHVVVAPLDQTWVVIGLLT